MEVCGVLVSSNVKWVGQNHKYKHLTTLFARKISNFSSLALLIGTSFHNGRIMANAENSLRFSGICVKAIAVKAHIPCYGKSHHLCRVEASESPHYLLPKLTLPDHPMEKQREIAVNVYLLNSAGYYV